MKQEDKELLLKDLCARLPYEIKCKDQYGGYIDINIYNAHIEHLIDQIVSGVVQMVLRPLSSMTEEEEMYLNGRILVQPVLYGDDAYYDDEEILSYVDYCYYRHLDIRGLISKGLALEAPCDMYIFND